MDQTLLLLLEIVYSKKRKNKNIRHDQIFMEYVIILLRNRIFLSLKPKKPKNCWWTYNISKASYSQDRSEKCSEKFASRCFAVHFGACNVDATVTSAFMKMPIQIRVQKANSKMLLCKFFGSMIFAHY